MSNGVVFQKIYRRILRLVFRFDPWHLSVPEERPYAMDIIAYCNERKERQAILEIGCGLGDILRRVNFKKKVGFDIDSKVLRAAGFLASLGKGPRIHFEVFKFPESQLHEVVDVLIMVNWIFFFEEEVLRIHIEKYFHENVKPGGAIILDTLKDPHYPNHHNVRNVAKNLSCKMHKIGNYARQREVWSIEKPPIVV